MKRTESANLDKEQTQFAIELLRKRHYLFTSITSWQEMSHV
jgi:hypothetical protein